MITKQEMWDLAKEVAKSVASKQGAKRGMILEMEKDDLVKYDERLSELPLKWRDIKEQGGDEDDTIEYFKTLCEFHLACLLSKEKKILDLQKKAYEYYSSLKDNSLVQGWGKFVVTDGESCMFVKNDHQPQKGEAVFYFCVRSGNVMCELTKDNL